MSHVSRNLGSALPLPPGMRHAFILLRSQELPVALLLSISMLSATIVQALLRSVPPWKMDCGCHSSDTIVK